MIEVFLSDLFVSSCAIGDGLIQMNERTNDSLDENSEMVAYQLTTIDIVPSHNLLTHSKLNGKSSGTLTVEISSIRFQGEMGGGEGFEAIQ